MTAADLIEAAREAARFAHAPYSNFAVGAAIRLSEDRIVSGSNFESASYGLSLCAEAVALATVNSQGDLANIVEIAIIGGGPDSVTPTRPCGRCRQLLAEAGVTAGRDIIVHCVSGDGSTAERYSMSELLPFAFSAADLGRAPKPKV